MTAQINWVERITDCLHTLFHVELEQASSVQLHEAVARTAMEILAPTWLSKERAREGGRQAYYLSAEYLTGRLVYNNLFCMGTLETLREQLAEKGVDLACMEDVEDAALGNGGLGRLAACFLDSAVTHDVPLTGYGLRYRYGLFKQSFEHHCQKEEPDDWTHWGDPWSLRRADEAVLVRMRTGDVLAIPYDMPIVGYGAKNVGTLRLWQCESPHEIDIDAFNRQEYARASADKNRAEDITKFLYPNDNRLEGQRLRVKQQYVLVSASIQDMLRRYRARHGADNRFFAAEHAVQLNDTHPVMAIPELIRLLMQDGAAFEEAFAIAREVFSYTNHTVMQEALEKWDLKLLASVAPEIVSVIRLIDRHFRNEMAARHQEVLPTRCVIEGNRVHMAQLAVYATHTTNGVAALHSEILKRELFADWYAIWPERFQNKTNGITQRRWLGLCNPEFSALLKRWGAESFMTELDDLGKLKSAVNERMVSEFRAVKRIKKEQLVSAIARSTGIELSADMLFDVQIKRLHEYKRQLMNAFSIMAIYFQLKDGTLKDFTPTAFIFGAKAAAGYARAKAIIRYINQIADLVNGDPQTNQLLRVVFVPNYNCSWAEKIIPAADVSEQISPAGTEASGTGNMKLMLNGAVTLGTFDGANIEIVEEAGRENNYIFGSTVEELASIKADYNPRKIYQNGGLIARVLDTLVDGTFEDPDGGLRELYTSILAGATWHKPDHYFILQDFPSYLEAKLRANRDYAAEPEAFAKKCLVNALSAGKFSSDRTILEYARDIWRV